MDGKQNRLILTIKDIVYIAMFSSILFVQEELLTFIPNVSLTIFLILIYSKKLGFYRTSIIIFIHVILDNLVMGSLNLLYVPVMFIGWMFIPIITCLFFKNNENALVLAFVGLVSGFLYCWSFIPLNIFVYNLDLKVYLSADILFEITLAACGFLTTLILYNPISRIFDKLIKAGLEINK